MNFRSTSYSAQLLSCLAVIVAIYAPGQASANVEETGHEANEQTPTALLDSQPSLSVIRDETLDIAWEIALDNNYQLKTAEQRQFAAQDKVAETGAQRFPNVVLSANYLSLDNPPTIQSTFADTDFTFSYWQQNALYYSVYSSVPLYTSGRIKEALIAANQQAEAAELDTRSEQQNLKMAVARAYIDILRANHTLLLARSHVASLEKHQADVANLKQQGLVSNSDLLSANVSLADARQALTRAKNLSELAFAAYNQLLGRDLDIRTALQEPETRQSDNNLGELTLRALQQREELIALRKRVKALQHSASSAKAASGPQVTLGGGYAYQENENQLYEEVWFANIGMVWKLFDGGVTRHRTSSLNHQASALKSQHDNLGELIRLQVRQAWLRIAETRERLEVTRSSILQAEENLKITGNRYREGLASHSEVLDAETLRIKSQGNHANARYDSLMAQLELKRATGEL